MQGPNVERVLERLERLEGHVDHHDVVTGAHQDLGGVAADLTGTGDNDVHDASPVAADHTRNEGGMEPR